MIGGTREIKVGLFVFVAFILLTVIIFSISDFYTMEPKYNLRIQFSFANGVQVGAPVRLVGVNVGEVRSIRVYRDETRQRMQAEVGIRLNQEARLEEDSTAYINTLGLIGEKYVEIVPGTPGARIVAGGEILKGKDSIPTEMLMESGFRVVQQLEKTIAAVNAVVGDEATQAALKETVAHSAEASERLSQVLGQANSLLATVREGEGTVGKLLTKDDLYKDLQALMADLKAHPWKLLYRPKGK